MTQFHEKAFDASTQLKLTIFKKYIREWLSVFMTKPGHAQQSYKQEIQIFDFFAGPGYDAQQNPGSPIIIADEIKKYCLTTPQTKANVSVQMFFNDINQANITSLQQNINTVKCGNGCCKFSFSQGNFSDELQKTISIIKKKGVANLIIMDQFGVKEVTPTVVQFLAQCQKTDILFFISSSIIRRFSELPEIKQYFKFDSHEVKDIDYKMIHQYICEYFKKCITNSEYYLVPFSIKKGANIYGIIFGTASLKGLEKFLRVCWGLDSKTGEANYSIYDEGIWDGQISLFSEQNEFKKINKFQNEVLDFIKKQTPNNTQLYKFVLQNGFSISKANDILSMLQQNDSIETYEIKAQKKGRKGCFYLGYNYFTSEPKISIKAKAN